MYGALQRKALDAASKVYYNTIAFDQIRICCLKVK